MLFEKMLKLKSQTFVLKNETEITRLLDLRLILLGPDYLLGKSSAKGDIQKESIVDDVLDFLEPVSLQRLCLIRTD